MHHNAYIMDTIQVKDKNFRLSISAEEIGAAVTRVAAQMNKDLAGTNPMFLPILNGAFMFASDLLKQVIIPSELSFIKIASYQGATNGELTQLIGLNKSIEGRTVVIIEDIVDTGYTMEALLKKLTALHPKTIKTAVLLSKPQARKVEVPLDYVGIEVPNRFIVGYGLDYDGGGRNLGEIYELI